MARSRPEDMHRDDVDNLNQVRAQLVGLMNWNIDKGISATAMAESVGRTHWFLHVLTSQRTWPGFWKFSTFHDLCLSVGVTPAVTHPFGGSGPLWSMALDSPKLLGVACQEVLETQRAATGSTVTGVADAVGVSKSAVWRAENSADPRLSTLQRYARVYDGFFKFGMVSA